MALQVVKQSDEWLTFGELEERLHQLGYRPVPIPIGGKRPTEKRWPDGRDVGGWKQTQRLSHQDTAGVWTTDWYSVGGCGVGLLTQDNPAIDLDIRERELVRIFGKVLKRIFGQNLPVRVGRYPKILIPFQLDGEPFRKLKLDWKVPGQKEKDMVEVLCRGQQFVASAIHPGTGEPYRWNRPIWEIPRTELPKLSRDQAIWFLRMCAKALEDRVLYDDIACHQFTREPTPYKKAPRVRRPYLLPGETARPWWETYTAKEVAEAVSPGDAHYSNGHWRGRCPAHHGVGNTSFWAKDQGGHVIYGCFNGCDSSTLASEIRRCLDD